MKTTPIREKKKKYPRKVSLGSILLIAYIFYFYGPVCVISLSYNGTFQMTSGNQKKIFTHMNIPGNIFHSCERVPTARYINSLVCAFKRV